MKKHIFGLAIFSFIVSAAAIVYAVFNVAEIMTVSVPQYDSTRQPTSCWKMKRESKVSESNAPLIKQSTLSLESGLFILEIGCVKKSQQLFLYFYEKNEGNTKLIATEKIELKSLVNCGNNSSLYKNFSWTKEINQDANIYVIALTSSQEAKFSKNFNESLAVPVLITIPSSKLMIN